MARGRTLLIPAIVSAIAVASVVWWASRQQLPALPAASVALPRLAAALVLYALATALRELRTALRTSPARAGSALLPMYPTTVTAYASVRER